MNEAVKIREFEKIIIVDVGDQVVKEEKYDFFGQTLFGIIAKKKNVGVNLKDLSYINSRVIGIFLQAAKEIHQHSRDLYLISASEKVEALLYVNGLDRIVYIVDKEEGLLA